MESPIHKFKILHSELQLLLAAPQLDEENAQKKVTRYIAHMVEDDPREQEKMFDHFCEFNGADIFRKLMSRDPLLAIKAYSLLFINLKNEMWTSYILCQPFLSEAITLRYDCKDEEYIEYFVSFLKSLSIRINASQVTLFYNKKNCTFPLVMAAMKYFNHSDFMVRTSVMNIVLELMKNKEEKAQLYFSRFPFTSYLINFACEVNRLIEHNHTPIVERAPLLAKQLNNYKVDLSDYLYYFNDLIEFGTQKAVEVIEQTIISYIIVPVFHWLIGESSEGRVHALLIIQECLRVIKSQPILDIIALLLLKIQISQTSIDKIAAFTEVYQPEVFRKEFDPHGNYWGDYDNEITGHCLEIFKDVQRFQVEYEEHKREENPKFRQEISRISQFIDYDLLTNQFLSPRFSQQLQQQTALNPNPFRKVMIQALKSAESPLSDLVSAILLSIINHQRITTTVKEQCGINLPIPQGQSLSPFASDIKGQLKESLVQIKWQQTRVKTMCNTLSLLKLLISEPQSIEFEQDILRNYRDIANHVRELIKADNMQFIVQQFSRLQAKAREDLHFNPSDLSIPYSILLLPQDQWQQPHQDYCLPSKPNDKTLHLIHHFFLFRFYTTNYFTRFYEAEYPDFQSLYATTFSATRNKWKVGENYKISNRALILCSLEAKDEKKNKKAVIVEDKLCFVLGELAQISCKIVINSQWKDVSLQLSREDGNWLQIMVGEQRFRLGFEDQARSNTTLVRLNDLRWEYCQFQLSFISRFVKAACEE